MQPGRNHPRRWRELAAEALAVAEEMTDPEARQIMLAIAAGYERLVRRAEERGNDKEPQSDK